MKKYYYGLDKKAFNKFKSKGIIDFKCEPNCLFNKLTNSLSPKQKEILKAKIEENLNSVKKERQKYFYQDLKSSMKICIFRKSELQDFIKDNDYSCVIKFLYNNICNLFREQDIIEENIESYLNISKTIKKDRDGNLTKLNLTVIIEIEDEIFIIKFEYDYVNPPININNLASKNKIFIKRKLYPNTFKEILLSNYSQVSRHRICTTLNDDSLCISLLNPGLMYIDIEDIEEILKN